MEAIAALQSLPDGVRQTLTFTSGFDACFIPGFANLDGRSLQTLQSLPRIFADTPLNQPLTESLAAIRHNEFLEPHFLTLAAARIALQGAQFDALQQQVWAVLCRPPIAEPEFHSDAVALPTSQQTWLESTRHWLMELALAGFARLEAGVLIPFLATLEQIQGEPALARLSALLTGFFYELLEAALVTDVADIPIRRWMDLWSQAMVGAVERQPSPPSRPVSGDLCLFGFDIRQHAHMASLVAWGALENGSQAQVCRITLSAYKVGTISGDEVWLLFPQAALLLEAVAQRRALRLDAAPLLPGGDLLWDGRVTLGGKVDPIATAARWFAPTAPQPPAPGRLLPVDRHPVQLAEPIFLENYAVQHADGRLQLEWGAGLFLPLAMERINPLTGLTTDLLVHSHQLFGLLRFDADRWSVQPLAVSTRMTKGKAQTILSGEGGAALLKKPPKHNTVAILRERAGRLLRAR